MNRFVSVAVLLASACGSATDDRPPTLEYITEAILAPTCAMAECHSAFKRQVGDVFDTPDSVRRTIVAIPLAVPEQKDAPDQTRLIRVLTVGEPSILSPGSGNVRMPYVSPMPDADIELIRAWIRDGIPGAQCVPNDQNRGCQTTTIMVGTDIVRQDSVVECVDGNIGATIQVCTSGHVCEYPGSNGQCSP